MRKILLVYPKHAFSKTQSKLPLSLLYLAKPLILRGYQVVILDQRVLPDFYNGLSEELLGGVLCVGISTMSGMQLKYAVEITDFIKKHFPASIIVWGGSHPTIFPEETLRLTAADIVVYGEGEVTFSELVDALSAHKDILEVKGLYLRKDNSVIFTGSRGLIDVNSITGIPYHLVDAGRNTATHIKGEKSLMYIPDRGCPNVCKFCWRMFKSVRLADAEIVIDNILDLLRLGVNTIDIGSENFFLSASRVMQICDYLIKNEIKVVLKAACSLNIIDKWDVSFMEMLKKAGFDFIQIGVESGSNRVLKLIKKNITVEQVLRVNEKLKQAKIIPMYSFYIGSPFESPEEIIMTVDLVFKLLMDYPDAATTNLQKYKPYPGTELFDISVKEYGYKEPGNIMDYIYLSDVNYPWASKKHQRLLNTISIVSYFFDEKSVANVLSTNKILRSIIKFYSKSVVYRCKKRMFWFFPEGVFLKMLENDYS